MNIKIDSHIRAPGTGQLKKAEGNRRAKLFRDYAYWYGVVYVKEPINMQVNKETGYISWEANGVRQPGVSEKRLRELISMLKSRAKG